ncbi:uncharacterized protein LOC110433088 [Sorghum bicolor]|uniref:Uncharacterized protein n=1 Tax=Sorghum bicolor TaxID=4558 RepID=C5X575_SORBI|nr:uncharacterized protein LOC110433088 [Sorghum bicolor]EER96325.2 hypothetical protein SORBI_3002G127700 [Sorghum bicolor]|eukprot:XP_021310386.1 uncharacterized protein LOC110433088 [Sorghum bicolor]
MKIRRGWGRNFMAKFNCGGAKKDTEPEAKLTPSTKISGRAVESPKKLVNTAPTRCSSQRARQETVDRSNLSKKLDKKRQEEWDKEIKDGHSVSQEEPVAKLDITMIVQSMKRGNRSARQRRKSSVPWVELLGFNFRNVERGRRNDQAVGPKKMKRTHRGTKSLSVKNRVAKGKKSVGGGRDANNKSTPANLDKAQDNAAETDAAEHLSVPKSDTSSKSKEQYASKQSGVLVPVPVPADDTLMNNISVDFKKSKDAVADGLMTTTDVISLYEAKENHTKFDPAIIPGLDLEDGADKFDTSTAQSALASLYTVSAPDPCIEFAVKLLKDETPLTGYVPEVDEIIRKMMCHQKSTTAGTSKSAQGKD